MNKCVYHYILTFCLLLFAGTTLSAADFTLKGKVVDNDGNAVELASVTCASVCNQMILFTLSSQWLDTRLACVPL